MLELTESVLVEDVDAAVDVLADLRGLGVRLALDDFGAGPSSLRRLRRAPLTTARLDAALLDEVADDPDERAVLEAMLALLDRLGLRAVAAGVRTPQQLRLFRE